MTTANPATEPDDATRYSTPSEPSTLSKAVTWFKASVGWACIALLLFFVFTNWQSTDVRIVNATLTAPVGLIVVLSALLGAVGANSFRTLLSWVISTEDSP